MNDYWFVERIGRKVKREKAKFVAVSGYGEISSPKVRKFLDFRREIGYGADIHSTGG